jgi:predicted transcriptional regulator of viral defense system
MQAKTARDKVLHEARKRPFLTSADAGRAGVHSQELTRLVRSGELERVSRGRYRLPGREITEHHALAIVAAASPGSVICLLSALAFHGIGTQVPFEIWVAVERGTRAPTVNSQRLRVVRFSGDAFRKGIDVHRIEGERVRVYNVGKTIADLFKYRNKIGIDVALEALRDAWRRRKVTIDEIDRYARVCRVERVMRPYLEALVS